VYSKYSASQLRDFRAVESEGFGVICMWVGDPKNSASESSDVNFSSNSRREDCGASGFWFLSKFARLPLPSDGGCQV